MMIMNFRFIKLLLLGFLVSACAKQESQPQSQIKNLHSIWHAQSPNWTLDFMDVNHVKFTYWTGGSCETNSGISWADNENSGWLSVIKAFPSGTTPEDPPCTQFEGTWTYQVLVDGHLLLCPEDTPADCVDFQ